MAIRTLILGWIFFCSSCLLAQEKNDVIVMKNGDRLTGEIKGLSGGTLMFSLKYVDGDIAVQWSEVSHLESNRVFVVKTESGVVYTGKVTIAGDSKDPPIKIELVEPPAKDVEVAQRKIIKLNPISQSFWRRFDGAINTGFLYSKGNESAQYNLSSQVAYIRERWSSGVNFNSSLASSSGANVTTRNQTDIEAMRLMSNNWFYVGSGSFLQSSVQQIDLQTTVAGGVGRYLKNTNRASISLLGGLGWQNARYGPDLVTQGSQNTAVVLVGGQIKAFKFKKTNLDVSASVIPAITDIGRVHLNTNAVYYIKIVTDLSWNFSFYGSWDTRPPATFSKSDYGTSSGLSWTFGNR